LTAYLPALFKEIFLPDEVFSRHEIILQEELSEIQLYAHVTTVNCLLIAPNIRKVICAAKFLTHIVLLKRT